MAFSVQMPALGESVSEGTVTRWLKKEGDTVEVDEPLLEVSTDKVDTEIPSPTAGTLTKIIADEDETVEIGGELALIDDGSGRPEAATRGYDLDLSGEQEGAPLLTVYGGKITTYRHLAAEAVEMLAKRLPELRGDDWTGIAPLPGGDFAIDGADALAAAFAARFPFLQPAAQRLIRAYGTTAFAIFAGANSLADCGIDFGHGLSEREVRHLIEREWACTADDVLWRRTKLGLHMSPGEAAALEEFMDRECRS